MSSDTETLSNFINKSEGMYLHCKTCIERDVPDKIAVRVEGLNIEVVCENHEEHQVVYLIGTPPHIVAM